jgi:hypothetical protein
VVAGTAFSPRTKVARPQGGTFLLPNQDKQSAYGRCSIYRMAATCPAFINGFRPNYELTIRGWLGLYRPQPRATPWPPGRRHIDRVDEMSRPDEDSPVGAIWQIGIRYLPYSSSAAPIVLLLVTGGNEPVAD